MKDKFTAKFSCVLALIFVMAHYYGWIYYVGAFPSENGHYNFYAPMSSYLYLSDFLPDHSTLMTLFPEKFPYGIGIILYVISGLGLSSLFISYPWIIFAPSLVLLVLIAYMSDNKAKNQLLFICSLYFFPISQLTLKSFSIHCLIIYLFIFAIVVIDSDEIKNKSLKLVIFGVAIFFTMSFKHLGVILVACYMLTLFLCNLKGSCQPKWLQAYMLCLSLLALPFYFAGSSSYSYSELALHNPYLVANLQSLLPVIVILGVLFLSFWIVVKGYEVRDRNFPSLFSSPLYLVLYILPLLPFFYFEDLKTFYYYGVTFALLIFVYALYLVFNYDSSSTKAKYTILFLLTYSIATFLYSTRFAITGDVFFFSLIFMSYMFFKQSTSSSIKYFVATTFVLMSSLTPNYVDLYSMFGKPATIFYQYYVDGFHQNPLSWSKSDIQNNRKSIRQILNKLDLKHYGDNFFSGFVNMHPFQFQVLEVLGEEKINNPHISTLIKQIEKGISTAFNDYHKGGDKLFVEWLDKGMFLYFLYSEHAVLASDYSFSTEKGCTIFLDNVSIEDYDNNYPLRVQVAIALQNKFFFWVNRTKKLKENYSLHQLDGVQLYTLKYIPLKDEKSIYKPFSQLVDFYVEGLELQDLLLEKGKDYFDSKLLEAKNLSTDRCKESKVLCQAIQESILFFSIDRQSRRKATATLTEMDKDWMLSEAELQSEHSKFKKLFTQIVKTDVRLANSMMSIGQRKFNHSYSLKSLDRLLDSEKQEDDILRKAQELWVEGNKFLDMSPPNFRQAHQYLEKAILLNPKSKGIRQDYETALRNLN